VNEITITAARGKLAEVVDAARTAPVYLTRRHRAVAALVDVQELDRLTAAAEELADIRAVDAAWEETERLAETPVPWADAKRDLGLAP
jgi:prevent-host-death family protein